MKTPYILLIEGIDIEDIPRLITKLSTLHIKFIALKLRLEYYFFVKQGSPLSNLRMNDIRWLYILDLIYTVQLFIIYDSLENY